MTRAGLEQAFKLKAYMVNSPGLDCSNEFEFPRNSCPYSEFMEFEFMEFM